jgi:hypothetical protein
MSYYISGVKCDTYAYLDQRNVGNTVYVSESRNDTHKIIVFLRCNYCDFPLDPRAELSVSCYVRHKSGDESVDCSIGGHGEIIVPLPKSLCKQGQIMTCEIKVAGITEGQEFRYRAFDFGVVVGP